MKAAVMTAPGGPEVLQIQQIPEPTLQTPTQVLIQVKAAGVNPIDTKLRQRGSFYPDQAPTVLGCDGAGIVTAVGAAVERFQIGDEVYFCQGGLGGPQGNYAEWIVVEERSLAHKPASLSFVEAAAAPLVLITAWEALHDRGRIHPGQQVLIHAGAGGVGHVAIQLAHLEEAFVMTTVSTPEKAALVQELGADQIVFYRQTDFVRAALDWTEGDGVDLAFDTIGGSLLSKTFPAVRYGGDIVTILEADPATDWKTARTRNLRISFELMLTPMLQGLVDAQRHQAWILEQCTRLIDQGQLKIQVSQTLPLSEAAEAHRLLGLGSTTGKIVLLIDP